MTAMINRLSPFEQVENALSQLRNGGLIVVTDDDNREHEGDLIGSAELCTPEQISFMANEGRGLICLPMDGETAKRLKLFPMVSENDDPHGTAFTASIDAVSTTTGISAFERCKTIKLAAHAKSTATFFRKPGHVFPLIAKKGGVLERPGHTEATVDLMRLAGLQPVGVCCEIMGADGQMLRGDALKTFCKDKALPLITVSQLIQYRQYVQAREAIASAIDLPTAYGDFKAAAIKAVPTGLEHFIIWQGDLADSEEVLFRMHSECLTGDLFKSNRCDCGLQLEAALQQIASRHKGLLIYLRQEGRGIGLVNKIKAYELQAEGCDTIEANERLGFASDLREYSLGSAVIEAFRIRSVKVMTNNPDKLESLRQESSASIYHEPLQVTYAQEAAVYMQTKHIKMGHLL